MRPKKPGMSATKTKPMKKQNKPRQPLEEPYRDWAIEDARRNGYEPSPGADDPVHGIIGFIRKGPRPGPPLAGPGHVLFDGRAAVLALVALLFAALALVAFFLA